MQEHRRGHDTIVKQPRGIGDILPHPPASGNIPNDVFAFLGKYNLHWWRRRRINTAGTIGEWEYLFSADSNAHPKSGIVSGYEYEYIGIPYKNFTSPLIQVAYGKYTGTGAWGESSPNKLTFSFAPKVVFVVQ